MGKPQQRKTSTCSGTSHRRPAPAQRTGSNRRRSAATGKRTPTAAKRSSATRPSSASSSPRARRGGAATTSTTRRTSAQKQTKTAQAARPTTAKKRQTKPTASTKRHMTATGAVRVADPRKRMKVLAVLAVLLIVIITGKLFYIQGMDPRQLAERALDSRLVTLTLPASRGVILAADGTVLADNAMRYRLVADQQNVGKYKNDEGVVIGAWGAAEELAEELDTDPGLLYPTLHGDRQWSVVADGITSEVWQAIKARDIPGITADEYAIRSYPAGAVGGNLLGFVGSDGQALAGLELQHDDTLRGTDGEQQYERGLSGDIIPLGDSNITPAKNGQGLQLSLDSDVQYYSQQAIAEQVKKHEADWGSVTIFDVETGRIIAAAEAPSVDPNNPSKVDAEDRGSRIFSGFFEPGSTSKMITAAALLDTGKATPTDEFVVPDTWTAPNGEKFRDSSNHPDQKLTVAGILMQSSNTGTILSGDKLSLEERYDYFSRFGFGQSSGIDFPASTRGMLHPPDEWDGRTKYTVMFGQGVAATSLQTTAAMATIANGGKKVTPQLITGTVDDSGRVTEIAPAEPERIISEQAADELMRMLEGVVVEGTGQSAQIPGYRAAGKTGTAQAPSEDGGYDGYTASFDGAAPAEDPKIAVSVTLQRPRKGYYGGTAAAPVFSDVAGFTLRHMGVPPSTEEPDLYPGEWK